MLVISALLYMEWEVRYVLDVATSLIPFISHNDCVRCQMAATQSKQAIPLIKPEVPFIRTGFEERYLHYTSYL